MSIVMMEQKYKPRIVDCHSHREHACGSCRKHIKANTRIWRYFDKCYCSAACVATGVRTYWQERNKRNGRQF